MPSVAPSSSFSFCRLSALRLRASARSASVALAICMDVTALQGQYRVLPWAPKCCFSKSVADASEHALRHNQHLWPVCAEAARICMLCNCDLCSQHACYSTAKGHAHASSSILELG